MNKGFTLVESLVTIFIIAVLSLIILPNYNSIGKQLALQRSAFKLAQDMRTVQEMAMSAQEFGGAIPQGGYGIRLSSGTSYIIFADNGDGIYNSSEKVEDISLENGMEINSINPGSLQAIIFSPPDPEVSFMNSEGNDIGIDGITIKVVISGDVSKSIDIIINRAGLIDIE